MIYPVPLQKWFPNNKRDSQAKFLHDIVRAIVDMSKCEKCGKHCKWNRAYGHHSLPFGYGEVFCSKYCVHPMWRE